jgi:hypothetical protein
MNFTFVAIEFSGVLTDMGEAVHAAARPDLPNAHQPDMSKPEMLPAEEFTFRDIPKSYRSPRI